MFAIPEAAEPLAGAIRGVFTSATYPRFVALMGGMIVTMGRRTVSRALRVIQPLCRGHWSDYHRIYSQAKYSMWKLAAVLARQVIALLPKDQVIVLLADDTVDGKDGDRVWARGGHRDAVRSSRSRDNIKFGHKWLVLCVLVQLPGIARPWALPVLCGLCCSPKVAEKANHRARTASQITRGLLLQMLRWFPDRMFVLIGDYGVVGHETAWLAHRRRTRVTVIGHLRGDASLYHPPKDPNRPTRGGGHAKKGRRKLSPRRRARQVKSSTETVAWYGGGKRTVRYVSDTGLWHNKHTTRVVPIRWVGVLEDKKANLEERYFFTTDESMPAARIIELYALRWNIEVTFEEARGLLGLETTRHWCRQSVLRVTPLLFGLFSAVALLGKELSKEVKVEYLSQTPCYHKRSMTFSDALYLVRRELWERTLLRHREKTRCLITLSPKLHKTLLTHLAAAA